jgi:hypothetical protein
MKHPLYTHIKKYHPKYHPLYKFLDYERMEDICLKPEEWLLKQMKHMQVVDTPDGQQYGYLKRGSKVLAVAHMDSVQQYERTNHFGVSPFCAERYTHEETIYNGQLDDRLGVYIVMDLLSKIMKNPPDILLTTGEESGRSTARYFDPAVHGLPADHYNWMVEFDCTGDSDAKTYQYDDADFHERLAESGFVPAWGSYTDIVSLEQLGVLGFNVAVGYYRYHNADAYAIVNELLNQVARFVHFHDLWHDTEMVYTPMPQTSRYAYAWNDDQWGDENLYHTSSYENIRGFSYNQTLRHGHDAGSSAEAFRPNNFLWMNNKKLYEKWTQTSDGNSSVIYLHKATGHMATICSQCNHTIWEDDATYVRGFAVCDQCKGQRADFALDDLQWMMDGGVLIKDANGDERWTRDVLDDDQQNYFTCDICEQLALRIKRQAYEHGDKTYNVCPGCFTYLEGEPYDLYFTCDICEQLALRIKRQTYEHGDKMYNVCPGCFTYLEEEPYDLDEEEIEGSTVPTVVPKFPPLLTDGEPSSVWIEGQRFPGRTQCWYCKEGKIDVVKIEGDQLEAFVQTGMCLKCFLDVADRGMLDAYKVLWENQCSHMEND